MKSILFSILFFILIPFSVSASYLDDDVWNDESFDSLTDVSDNVQFWKGATDQWPAISTTQAYTGTKSMNMKCSTATGTCRAYYNGHISASSFTAMPEYSSYYFYIDDIADNGDYALRTGYNYCSDSTCYTAVNVDLYATSSTIQLKSNSDVVFENISLDTWHLLQVDINLLLSQVRYRLDSGDWSSYYDINDDPENRLLRRIYFQGHKSDENGKVYVDDLVFSTEPRTGIINMKFPAETAIYKDFPTWSVQYSAPSDSATTTVSVSVYRYETDTFLFTDTDTVIPTGYETFWTFPKSEDLLNGNYYLFANLSVGGVNIATSSTVQLVIDNENGLDFYTDYFATSSSELFDYDCSQYGLVGESICLLFAPSADSLNKFKDLYVKLQTTPPTSYFYDLYNFFVVLDDVTDLPSVLPEGSALDNLFDMLKDSLFPTLIYIVAVFYTFRRVIKFKW